jgi:hypothetical protein
MNRRLVEYGLRLYSCSDNEEQLRLAYFPDEVLDFSSRLRDDFQFALLARLTPVTGSLTTSLQIYSFPSMLLIGRLYTGETQTARPQLRIKI